MKLLITGGAGFDAALLNSIGIGLITTVIAVVIGGMAAYAVARLEFDTARTLCHALLTAQTPERLATDTPPA